MTGSDKQIKWAEAIKADFAREVAARTRSQMKEAAHAGMAEDEAMAQLQPILDRIQTAVDKHVNAGWWIDNRYNIRGRDRRRSRTTLHRKDRKMTKREATRLAAKINKGDLLRVDGYRHYPDGGWSIDAHCPRTGIPVVIDSPEQYDDRVSPNRERERSCTTKHN